MRTALRFVGQELVVGGPCGDLGMRSLGGRLAEEVWKGVASHTLQGCDPRQMKGLLLKTRDAGGRVDLEEISRGKRRHLSLGDGVKTKTQL